MSPKLEQTTATDWLRKVARRVDEHDSLPMDEQLASATRVEAWLQKRQIRYAPACQIPMAMIDEKRSRQNQARRDPLVAESIERFQATMRAGQLFPPIVLYPLGNKLIIIDGNNRHEAAKRQKREEIFGIVVDETTDSDMIQLLTVEANASHGVTPPVEWRVRQAFYLVSIGHGDDVAAEAAGISVAQLRNARAAAEAESRAKVLRIHGFAELGLTHKQYLNGIKMEAVFHAAAKLAAENKLTLEQVRDLCKAIRTGKSESEQLSIVAEQQRLLIAENAAKKALTRRVNSPKTTLVAGIGMIASLDPSSLVSQIRTVHDRDAVNRRLREVEEKILEIQVEMEKLADMEE